MTRSILITGCSSGIGLDAARGMKARGWRVFATCRAQTDCDRLQAEGLESFPLDYADEASIAAAVEEVKTRTGTGFGYPEEAVNAVKQENITRAAEAWLISKNIDAEIRFDVISIVMSSPKNQIYHVADAFAP